MDESTTGSLADGLPALVARYFPPTTEDCRTFVGDSRWEPVIDGADYFALLAEGFAAAGAGDSIFLSGLSFEPDMDLSGAEAADPGYRAVADVLAERASEGVDVRVLLTGAVFSGSVPWPPIGPFRANVFAARTLRGWLPTKHPTVAVPPLRDRILMDWSGTGIGSNHQKFVLLHIGGELTAYVGGIDFVASRVDAGPHDRLRVPGTGERWGWHDGAARLTGPAAARVWEVFRFRWEQTATLPRRYFYLPPASLAVLNPELLPPTIPAAPALEPRSAPELAVRVLCSFGPWRIDAFLGLHRQRWKALPEGGVQEIYETLATAIRGARRYIYLEDQYFSEMPGGDRRYGLWDLLRDAAARGVRVILVGSGRRDPDDGGRSVLRRRVTKDLRRRVLDKLPAAQRSNVVMHRIEDLTVHTKVVLIDDVFACLGSANFFSRSMVGTDTELSTAVVTTGSTVRDLRVRLWAEHLRTPVDDQLAPSLADLDLAMGIWRLEWLPPWAPAGAWHEPGFPAGFAPAERVLLPV